MEFWLPLIGFPPQVLEVVLWLVCAVALALLARQVSARLVALLAWGVAVMITSAIPYYAEGVFGFEAFVSHLLALQLGALLVRLVIIYLVVLATRLTANRVLAKNFS